MNKDIINMLGYFNIKIAVNIGIYYVHYLYLNTLCWTTLCS